MGTRRRHGSGVEWEERFGYSRAVRVGDRILVAGTTATGPDGVVGLGDPERQTRFVLERIRTAIEALDGRLEDVVRTRIFVAHLADWETIAAVHGEYFAAIRPVNTLVQANLVGADYLVEIEAEAVVGE